MNTVSSEESEGFWGNRLVRLLGGLLFALCLYVLSVGPVACYYGTPAPAWAQTVYGPLGLLPRPMVGVLEAYVQWWLALRKPRIIVATP